MRRYKSTRGDKKPYSFSEVILKGIAPDGGLFVPEKLPQLSEQDLQTLLNMSYQEKAAFIFNKFQTDFSEDAIKKIVNKAYGNNFDSKEIAPVVHLKENQYFLELWHGPTAAFKDMALQILPLFFLESVKKNKSKLHYLVLAATSGDTGTAAMAGYKNKENISIIVFYPKNRVSKFQELQMITQDGYNVGVFSVDGDFDKVQRLVRDIFNDREFNQKLESDLQTALSAANSINWGRLISQIVYHVSSYLNLVEKKVIKLGEPIDIAVPSGNFGNMLAAYYAKQMGLPVRKFICASNENDALASFLNTGIYDVRTRVLKKTPSPAMDILIAGNIERLLSLIVDSPNKIAQWMEELKTKRVFEVDEGTKKKLKEEFYADSVKNDECLDNIKIQFKETDYLMDPHTSVAQTVSERYIKKYQVTTSVIISSTAHWAKFARDMYNALYGSEADSKLQEFEIIENVRNKAGQKTLPRSISNIENKKKIHTESCSSDWKQTEEMILKWLEKKAV